MTNPPTTHNQSITDPISHFRSIPWCANLLSDPCILPQSITIPDRTPLASTESALVRETLNTSSTVRACITCLRYKKSALPPKESGEERSNPFLEIVALLDLEKGVNGYAGTAHGGFYGMVLDEVMGTAANSQAVNGAYTASLTVNFRRPLYTPSVVVVRGKVVKKNGKKVHVIGRFEDSKGKPLADATGFWVMVDRDIGRWTTEEQKLQAPKMQVPKEKVKSKL